MTSSDPILITNFKITELYESQKLPNTETFCVPFAARNSSIELYCTTSNKNGVFVIKKEIYESLKVL